MAEIYRQHAGDCTRQDRCGCAYMIIHRGPGSWQESSAFRAKPLVERVERLESPVGRPERLQRGGRR
jgi:hypothetical protein